MKREVLGIIVLVLSILVLTTSVSAINSCCEFTQEGEWCQYVDETECDADYLSAYTSCEQTSYCQVGTCYSSTEGHCYANTAQSTCENERGYTWTSDPIEQVSQCQQGCCVIADQAFYVTEVQCKAAGSEYEDAEVGFDDSFSTELECLNSVRNLDFGCCVTEEDATFVTREECAVATEEEPATNFTEVGFHEGMLCSNDLFSNECAKQHNTGCYNGKVYWYDSCGNRENIYSDDERDSYNNGYILDEEDSCVVDGVDDPSCGNCDYAAGTLCGLDKDNEMEVGEVICADLNCYDTYENPASPLSGVDRKNGESWCVYDARPGEAADPVGARHYRHLCINGEEIVEECADFREEICISGVLNEETLGNVEALGLGQGGSYVEAACRVNRVDCNICNDAEAGQTANYDCCTNEDVRDCMWYEIDLPESAEDPDTYIEDDTPLGICVPQVPPGQVFWSEDGTADTASDGSVCEVASTECSIEYRLGGVKNLLTGRGTRTDADDWEVVSETPDGCADREWIVQRNNLCRAQGDCGAHYNFIGDAGLGGFTSNIFDEEFFFEYEEFSEKDLGSWDFYAEVDEWDEAKDIPFGMNNPNLLKNPIFYAGVASFVVGGTAGLSACKNKEKYEDLQSDAVQSYGSKLSCYKGPEEKRASCLAKLEAKADKPTSTDDDDDDDDDEDSGGGGADSDDDSGGSSSEAPSLDDVSKLGNLKFGESAGCFVGSAVPLLGLFQKGYKGLGTDGTTKGIKDYEASELVSGAVTYGPQLASAAKKAQSAGTVSKVANVFTIAAVAYLAIEYGFENSTVVKYEANCGLWQPPSGGDKCEECNNIDTPCSEYKCRSLGASCDLVNAGTSNETCVSLHVNDVNSPDIVPLLDAFTDEYTITEGTSDGNNGFRINEKIPAFTNVQVGIGTNEPSQCKYTTEPSTEFQDMNNYFGDELYLYNHTLMFSLGSEVTEEEVTALTEGIFRVYIRCSDASGNANERDYYIEYEVDETPDLTPPEIVFYSLTSETYMPFELDEIAFSLYTSEPATCKWNHNDTDFNLMGGEMTCANSGYDQTSAYFGTYGCSTTLTGVTNAEINNYYFRCQDQTGNTNEESAKFVTYASEDELEIISVSPEGEITDSEVILEIETDGGADKGDANCRFSTEDVDYNSMIRFADSNNTQHSQVLTLVEGEYDYYFGCQDIAGNQAYSMTTFDIEVDIRGPQIEYIYVNSIYSVVYLETDENSYCEWAPEAFTYGEGTEMTGQGTTEHEANLESLYYYVTCEDEYENQNSYEVDLSAWTS